MLKKLLLEHFPGREGVFKLDRRVYEPEAVRFKLASPTGLYKHTFEIPAARLAEIGAMLELVKKHQAQTEGQEAPEIYPDWAPTAAGGMTAVVESGIQTDKLREILGKYGKFEVKGRK